MTTETCSNCRYFEKDTIFNDSTLGYCRVPLPPHVRSVAPEHDDECYGNNYTGVYDTCALWKPTE